MSVRKIRVALCQLESHPAIYSGHAAYPEEPFVPKSEGSLSRLGTKGIDVQALQDRCKAEYSSWSDARLRSVLAFLGRFDPAPDVVLFPEGGILLDSLPQLSAWSTTSGSTILAGTHTPVAGPAGLRIYSALSIPDKLRKKAIRAPGGSVLPLIRDGKVTLIPKRLPSPFERTDVSEPDPEVVSCDVYPIQTGAGRLDILPLVCIEALRLPSVKASYDLIAIVSYDAHPERFQPFIDQQVANRRSVLYCNDGHIGKSRVGLIQDTRTPSWFHDAFPDGLPPGDAVLLVEIDLYATTVEKGTAAPHPPFRLVSLASVVGEHAGSATVSRELQRIAGLPPGGQRAELLTRVAASSDTNIVQRLRINHLGDLERRGQESGQWWAALGQDCVVEGQDELRRLEARLAAACRDSLITLLSTENTRRPDVAPVFLQFYAECSSVAGEQERSAPVTQGSDVTAVIDRDAEVDTIAKFLDSRDLVILEMSGLPQIGKSSVLEKALAQSGVGPVLRVPLTSTSSPDYVLYTILKRGSGLPAPPYADPAEVSRSASTAAALRGLRVILFERGHLLTDFGAWKDGRFAAIFEGITAVARESGVKLIFETQRELPLDLADPGLRQRLRVTGLQKHLNNFGRALFDAQLRRVLLSPDVLSDDSKSAIVERLGGHPVAIALAADVSHDEGGEAVLAALKERKGFYLNFLQRLIRPLNLSDEEQTILRLLTLARVPVERSVVLGSVSFPAGPALRNLIALGAVEVTRDGRIEIAGILRDYFDPRELPPELPAAFHRAAATSFDAAARRNRDNLEAAVEAEYHGGVVGMALSVSSLLLDGALASAQEHFRSQEYDAASSILEVLLKKERSSEILRLAAQVAARRNDSERAIALAREVLTREPKDARLLADLAKIALSQFQDETTARLVEMARGIGVEDVSVLVVEGRMHLRRQELYDAERVLQRARQLTRHNPWPYYFLGITYFRMGRLDEAISVLEEGQEFFYRTEGRSRNALNAIRTQLAATYLLIGEVDAAGRILDPLLEEDPTPEVMRVYAALTIKRDGIQEAEKAFARLSEAVIRNRFDRCQLHLFYGLFQLGIGNPHEASREFAKAHAADRSNVYVMMKWARTLYEVAKKHYLEGDDVYEAYVSDCANLVQKILEFDPDNREGVSLLNSLHQTFGVDLGEAPERS